MSLVSTYVRAVDGKLYRNPTVVGDGWFVCFDDDDPVELVVFRDAIMPKLDWLEVGRPHACGRRCVPPEWKRMKPANAYWCELRAPIPVPTLHDGTVGEDDIWQGVIYDPTAQEEA